MRACAVCSRRDWRPAAANCRRLALALGVLILSVAPLAAAEPPTSIWVMQADGSQPRQRVRLKDHTYHRMPRWSHDGRQIAFYAANKIDFAHEVFIARADGSNPRKVAVGDCPDWSPDDKQLLFDTWLSPGFATEVLSLDDGGRQRLALGSGPRWNSDGSRIALLRDDHTPLVIDLLSGEEQALFAGPLTATREAIAWSPDGKSLALFAQPGPNDPMQLLIVNREWAEVSQRVRLKGIRGSVLNFSPDGTQIVFDSGGLIQVVDALEKDPPRVLPGQRGRNIDPQYSPDGKQIIFASNRQP